MFRLVQADYVEQGNDQWGNGKILLLPTIIVNKHQYRGRLDVPSVLRALCAGFSETTEPQVRAHASTCHQVEALVLMFLAALRETLGSLPCSLSTFPLLHKLKSLVMVLVPGGTTRTMHACIALGWAGFIFGEACMQHCRLKQDLSGRWLC